MKAAALIYALKDVRGYKISLQSVADTFKLENRQSSNHHRDGDSTQQMLQDKPFVALCIELYEKLQGTDDDSDEAGAKGHIHSGSSRAKGEKGGKKAGGCGALDHEDYIGLIREARALYKKGSVNAPRLLGIESMIAVLDVKCGIPEKDLRNKQKYKDRAAILMLFQSKLAMFREAATPALGRSTLSAAQATQQHPCRLFLSCSCGDMLYAYKFLQLCSYLGQNAQSNRTKIPFRWARDPDRRIVVNLNEGPIESY